VGLGKPHIYHLEVDVACHNDRMGHEVEAQVHNHEKDNPVDYHQVDNRGDRNEPVEEAVDPSFDSHHSHDALEVVVQYGSHGSPWKVKEVS